VNSNEPRLNALYECQSCNARSLWPGRCSDCDEPLQVITSQRQIEECPCGAVGFAEQHGGYILVERQTFDYPGSHQWLCEQCLPPEDTRERGEDC
jgi:hypothetical protein